MGVHSPIDYRRDDDGPYQGPPQAHPARSRKLRGRGLERRSRGVIGDDDLLGRRVHDTTRSIKILRGLLSAGLIAPVEPSRSPVAGSGCPLREIRASIVTRPALERLRPGITASESSRR